MGWKRHMVGSRLVEALKREICGGRALVCASEIARFHRARGSSDFARAARYIRDKLVDWGIDQAVIEKYPIDGKRTYGTWTPAPAWEPVRATLSIVHPESRPVCDFDVEPMCLAFGSTSTPTEGIVSEVVDIGDGKCDDVYATSCVAGKLVLTSGSARAAFADAVRKRGAIGVLTDHMAHEDPSIGRTRCDLPDAVNYASLPVGHEDMGRMVFGFSLSHRQAEGLRSLLKQGPVRVKAVVEARLFPGEMHVVTGLIPGSDSEGGEVLIIAHLCHPKPGANDNASGCGLAMEIARALADAIAAGRLPRPRLGVRLMFVPEMYGTMAYLERHPGWAKRVRAGVNLDMVGESRDTMSVANLVSTPWSLPSPVNDVAAFYMKAVAVRGRPYEGSEASESWHYNIAGFSGGSDHYILTDSSFKVPCVYIGHWPDRFYHSSRDTIEHLDAQELLRVGLVAGSTALTLAAGGLESAQFMLNVVDAGARKRIAEAASTTCEALTVCPDSTKKAEAARAFERRLDVLVEKDLAALDGVVKCVRADEASRVREMAKALKRGIRAAAKASRVKVGVFAGEPGGEGGRAGEAGRPGVGSEAPVERIRRSAALARAGDEDVEATAGAVYIRLFKGPLDPTYLYDRLEERRREHYESRQREDPSFQLKLVEAVNYMDGRRTLERIVTLVASEFPGFTLDDLRGFANDLERAGLARRK
ncbi:MAG: DUF4910 domain-containing protein [Firmicutes bacterium]|jgi:hypothetical protein|nr:DUF4910 domain-containing protein [Bacillota bacterium]MDH7496521.1 DUF4910 domain-containing protein [Bacillota bacterium]